jgi:hypothetical protein
MENNKTLLRIAEKLDELGISEEGIGELTTKDIHSFTDMKLYIAFSLEPETDCIAMQKFYGVSAFKEINKRLKTNFDYFIQFQNNLRWTSQ